MNLIKIGLEYECVIKQLNGDITHVKDWPQDRFPHDHMSCLAEIRGPAAQEHRDAVRGFLAVQTDVIQKYRSASILLCHGEHIISWDMASTSYETNEKEGDQEQVRNWNLIRGGGLHIHFSCINHPRRLLDPFMIVKCVKALDTSLESFVKGQSFYRRSSQALAKPWGFEYRSCFWNGEEDELRDIAKIAWETVTNLEYTP